MNECECDNRIRERHTLPPAANVYSHFCLPHFRTDNKHIFQCVFVSLWSNWNTMAMDLLHLTRQFVRIAQSRRQIGNSVCVCVCLPIVGRLFSLCLTLATRTADGEDEEEVARRRRA